MNICTHAYTMQMVVGYSYYTFNNIDIGVNVIECH